MKYPGQYVLAYIQCFIEAGATEEDKVAMERLLSQARRIASRRRLPLEAWLYMALAGFVATGIVLICQW